MVFITVVQGRKPLTTFCSDSNREDLLILQLSQNPARNQGTSLPILQVVLLKPSSFGFGIMVKQQLGRTILPSRPRVIVGLQPKEFVL